MAQELTTTDPDKARAQLVVRVGSLYSGIERDARRKCDTLPAPIDTATRKQLDGYRRDLHGRLQPISVAVAHREKAASAVALFLAGYLNTRTGDPAGTVRAYVAMLFDQPLFAILQALDDFKNRRVVDHYDANQNPVYFTLDYAPSAPRLLDQVKKCAGPTQEERHKVTRLLAIEHVSEPEVPEAERERVAVHMRKLADSLSMKNARIRDQEREKSRAEANEARERAARIVHEATERRRQQAAAHAE
jgi:hypothetical protein